MQEDRERENYETIKQWSLEVYFDGCRDLGHRKHTSEYEILGYVGYQFEGVFPHPTEQLMLMVCKFVLCAGRYPDYQTLLQSQISDIISKYGLKYLLAPLAEQELIVFKHDLLNLNLLKSTEPLTRL